MRSGKRQTLRRLPSDSSSHNRTRAGPPARASWPTDSLSSFRIEAQPSPSPARSRALLPGAVHLAQQVMSILPAIGGVEVLRTRKAEMGTGNDRMRNAEITPDFRARTSDIPLRAVTSRPMEPPDLKH